MTHIVRYNNWQPQSSSLHPLLFVYRLLKVWFICVPYGWIVRLAQELTRTIPLSVSPYDDMTHITLSHNAMTNKVFEVMKTTGCKNEIYDHAREFTPAIQICDKRSTRRRIVYAYGRSIAQLEPLYKAHSRPVEWTLRRADPPPDPLSRGLLEFRYLIHPISFAFVGKVKFVSLDCEKSWFCVGIVATMFLSRCGVKIV